MVFLQNMGLFSLTTSMTLMWLVNLTLIYLAITKKFEPLLLLPIGFGIIMANLPESQLMTEGEGLIWKFYHFGIEWEVIPLLMFLGLDQFWALACPASPGLSRCRSASRRISHFLCQLCNGIYARRNSNNRHH